MSRIVSPRDASPRRFAVAGALACALAVSPLAPAFAVDDADVVRPTTDFSKPERFERMSAGATTSRAKVNRDAFSKSSANMTFKRELTFKVGNGFFRRVWVSAPSSTKAADGLGPLFNAKSCQRCHIKDGRGHPPKANWPGDNAVSMFLRLSVPPRTDADRAKLAGGEALVIPEPTYGGQLQDFAIQGHAAEGRLHVDYTEVPVVLSGGETASLRKPAYSVTDLGYGPMRGDVMMSPRVAQQMIGLGLLEAVAEADIRAAADPDDADGDGISGKTNEVWSRSLGAMALGRFGWKAGHATVRDQAADAFAGDVGISTPHNPEGYGDCTRRQAACRAAPTGNDAEHENLEAPENVLDLVSFYSRNLAVPQRRDVGKPRVLAGKRVFYETGCIACHTPKYITPRVVAGMPEQSRQLIWPYTDLLLHDMGEGLADRRPEGRADGFEWRTPPLWGIGLTEAVNGHTFFLHDGRARSLLEAVLWHGGEAEAAKRAVVDMAPEDRRNLILFLESL